MARIANEISGMRWVLHRHGVYSLFSANDVKTLLSAPHSAHSFPIRRERLAFRNVYQSAGSGSCGVHRVGNLLHHGAHQGPSAFAENHDRQFAALYRPGKKLLDHVTKLIKGKPEYVLLDEQLVVYDKVAEAAKDGVKGRKKVAIIVLGGPGTGKSVIAMNLLGDLSGMGLNAHYVTGSRAFTSTIREIVGTRGAAQVRYFNSYMGADAK